MTIKEDVNGLKFFMFNGTVFKTIVCDYCDDYAIGCYRDCSSSDGYEAIDVCKKHYEESIE